MLYWDVLSKIYNDIYFNFYMIFAELSLDSYFLFNPHWFVFLVQNLAFGIFWGPDEGVQKVQSDMQIYGFKGLVIKCTIEVSKYTINHQHI